MSETNTTANVATDQSRIGGIISSLEEQTADAIARSALDAEKVGAVVGALRTGYEEQMAVYAGLDGDELQARIGKDLDRITGESPRAFFEGLDGVTFVRRMLASERRVTATEDVQRKVGHIELTFGQYATNVGTTYAIIDTLTGQNGTLTSELGDLRTTVEERIQEVRTQLGDEKQKLIDDHAEALRQADTEKTAALGTQKEELEAAHGEALRELTETHGQERERLEQQLTEAQKESGDRQTEIERYRGIMARSSVIPVELMNAMIGIDSRVEMFKGRADDLTAELINDQIILGTLVERLAEAQWVGSFNPAYLTQLNPPNDFVGDMGIDAMDCWYFMDRPRTEDEAGERVLVLTRVNEEMQLRNGSLSRWTTHRVYTDHSHLPQDPFSNPMRDLDEAYHKAYADALSAADEIDTPSRRVGDYELRFAPISPIAGLDFDGVDDTEVRQAITKLAIANFIGAGKRMMYHMPVKGGNLLIGSNNLVQIDNITPYANGHTVLADTVMSTMDAEHNMEVFNAYVLSPSNDFALEHVD